MSNITEAIKYLFKNYEPSYFLHKEMHIIDLVKFYL